MGDEAYYENRLKEEREKHDILKLASIRREARIAELEAENQRQGDALLFHRDDYYARQEKRVEELDKVAKLVVLHRAQLFSGDLYACTESRILGEFDEALRAAGYLGEGE